MEHQVINRQFVCPLTVKKFTARAITVVGLGYVGAVSTACLARLGHCVIGVDVDAKKRRTIAEGKSPIHERGLAEALSEGVGLARISTTGDLAEAVRCTDATFLSVGTPTAIDGGCDYSFIEAAADEIGRGLRDHNGFHVVVLRCSIPPGTTQNLLIPILETTSGKRAGRDFGVCFNPEFLREGVAVDDFFSPAKTVFGVSDDRSANLLSDIFLPIDPDPIVTSIEAAETVKYADNVWHATKVCFANEIGRLCKSLDVDSHEVMDVFVRDQKLNLSSYYLKPGFAYGGSCLPKEVRAVQHIGQKQGLDLPLINSLTSSNDAQISEAVKMIKATGKTKVGILGLAFKAGTDDLRESPILEVVHALEKAGIEVLAHDEAIGPEANLNPMSSYVRALAKHSQKGMRGLRSMLRCDLRDVMAGSEVLVVSHNTPTYRAALSKCTEKPVIDLVRLFKTPPPSAQIDGIAW